MSITEHNHLIYKTEQGFDYPIFYEYYEAAVATVWRHQEVPMESDLRDWQNATDEEREVISGVLKGFVTSELGIGAYWSNEVCAMFPKPEIQAMARTFAFFETIHAAAYAYLNDVLGLQEYEAFISDPVVVKKVSEFFLKLPPKVNLAVYSGGAEGVSLFGSFALLLSYNLSGRFKGLAQIISWSCVDGETEVLTPNGWVRMENYSYQKVAQFDPETKQINFVYPQRFIQSKSSTMYEINKHNRFDQYVTPNHRIIDYKEGSKQVRELTADKWTSRQSYLPVAGYSNPQRDIRPEERFMVALEADGCLKGPNEAKFYLKRQRKIDRFRDLANDLRPLGFIVTERPASQPKGGLQFTVKVPDPYSKYCTKTFSEAFTLDDIPNGFLEEVVEWDGHKPPSYYKTGGFYYSSKNKKSVEFVQAAASLFGYYCHIGTQDDHRWSKICRQYRLYLKKQDEVYARGSAKVEKVLQEPIDVFCFTLDTGAFLTRRNGLISVTGNCRDEGDFHSDAGCLLFKELVKEQGLTADEKQQIYDGMDLVLQNEFAFIDSIFQGRTIDNIDPEDMKSFLRVRVNDRLLALGLEPLELDLDTMKKSRNISEWFYPMVKGASSNDFFAQSKDGANYTSKISQQFNLVNLASVEQKLLSSIPVPSIAGLKL